MFISDGNISIRIAEPEDAAQIYRWENDRSLWRVSETICPTSLFQIEQFLLGNSDLISNRQQRFMVLLNGVKLPIGSIDLFDYDPINSRIGIGVLIENAYRGKGFATTSLQLCLNYLFNDLMVHQVHCIVDVTNEESHHLFKKLGFTESGRRHDWIKTPEGYVDVVFYQKTFKP